MQLLGYSTRRKALGTGAVFVPLGALTVVLGANDAGKSTLLAALDQDLRGGPPSPIGDESVESAGALYVEVSDGELERFLPRRARGGYRFSASWRFGGYDAEALDDAGGSRSYTRPDDWLEQLRAASNSPASFARVFDALSISRTVCLETEARNEYEPRRTTAYWCLPPLEELDADVVDALRESRLRRFLSGDHRGLHRLVGVLHFGGEAHLALDEAPIPVAPLGWQQHFAAPVPLPAPASFDAVRSAVTDAITRVVVAVRHGQADAAEATHWDRHELEARKPPGVWLTPRADGGWEVDRVVRWALDVLADESSRLLPPFVSERYELIVRLRDLSWWFVDDPIALELSRRDVAPVQVEFDIEQVAEGLTLWVQLALIGAAQELERLAGGVRVLAGAVVVDEARAIEEPDGRDDERPWLPSHDAWLELERAIETSAEGSPLIPDVLADSGAAVDALHRIVLVDEPERHLNPRLQRQAAAWLRRLVDESDTPCVAASHSTAFLSLPGPTVFAHVRRNGRRVTAERLDPASLDALDDVVQELGFDRGELLSTVGCFLLVEGVHDQIVLERVFARELRQAGVFVVPLRGGARRTLLDVDALWRFTTAPVALALDHIDPRDLAMAQSGDLEALARLTHANASEESKAAGNLLEYTRDTGRELHLLAHPGTDLIDALDDDAVAAGYPDYPGATTMQAAWGEHVRAGKEAGQPVRANQRKGWLQKTYGIDNSREAYTRIADEHVRLQRRPPGLEPVVTRAVELGMKARGGE